MTDNEVALIAQTHTLLTVKQFTKSVSEPELEHLTGFVIGQGDQWVTFTFSRALTKPKDLPAIVEAAIQRWACTHYYIEPLSPWVEVQLKPEMRDIEPKFIAPHYFRD